MYRSTKCRYGVVPGWVGWVYVPRGGYGGYQAGGCLYLGPWTVFLSLA